MSNAYEIGTEAGRASGSWAVDGNTTVEQAAELLALIDDCELDVPAPLSGEWAGESIPELSARFGLDLDDEDVADEFENGFVAGYIAEVERAARCLVEA